MKPAVVKFLFIAQLRKEAVYRLVLEYVRNKWARIVRSAKRNCNPLDIGATDRRTSSNVGAADISRLDRMPMIFPVSSIGWSHCR
jgi:hypothetical protein